MVVNKAERVHRFVSNDFTLRVAAVNATEVVREMQNLQKTQAIATVAVGRAMVGALLMASHLKNDQQVGLLFKGHGGLASVYAEASFEGHVRGYTPHPEYQPLDYRMGLSLRDALGKGTLSVSRHQPFQKQPHHGTVEMISGEIGDDIAHYLHQSHQIRSLVSLGVYLDTYGRVRAAGGLLLEIMPGVEDDVVDKVQANAEKATQQNKEQESISKLILDGKSPVDIVNPFLIGIPFTEIDHNFPIAYHCPCDQERVLRALEVMGVNEISDMIEKAETAEVTCQMCGRPYSVSVKELEDIRDRLHRSTMH